MLEKIERVCSAAVKHQAEDVFLQVGNSPNIRVRGKVLELDVEPTTTEEMISLAEDCGYDLESGDADLSWTSEQGMRYRINFYSSMSRSCAVLRLLKEVTQSISELGLPKDRMQDWLSRQSGLVLVTGATGSGKSTSLASCLNWIIKNHNKHIVTVEDPVEYILNSGKSVISQREVGADTESFGKGLRSALRQSPDVILVGEIRDYETAKVALHACETGHLVLSTIHSSNVAETFDRLLLLFPEGDRESARHVLSKQLIGVLCQKLVNTVDDSLYLVLEHLENAGVISKWIREGDMHNISDFIKSSETGGNKSFISSIISAYKAQLISEDVARIACEDPNEFNRMKLGVSHGSR